MPKRLRIIAACANGAGTSLMLKMSVEKAAQELGVPLEIVHHCSIAEGKSSAFQYDIVFVPLNFAAMLEDTAAPGTKVIGLKNVLSADEVKEKLKESGFVPKG